MRYILAVIRNVLSLIRDGGLPMADEEYLKILRQGAKAWTQWRENTIRNMMRNEKSLRDFRVPA
jgi:hypothetical protein